MVLVGDRRVGFDFLFGIDTPAVRIQQVAVGEPEFRELEPDGELAEPTPGTPTSRVI
jgi:hypothetical protein